VPGHSLFIRNMLAGTGCVPAVMLVIAADEGIKPQTQEHLAICELLEISHGITVVTKIDCVNKERLDEVRSSIATFLNDTFLGAGRAPILPVSAQTGEGLADVRRELLNLALRTQAANPDAPLRLPIDRSFVMKGFGTVVTGTLLSGTIREGQTLMLEPGARAVRVRGLQTHGEAEAAANAGTRVAVNLSGVDASDVHRGQTLVMPQTLSPVDIIDVEVTLLPGAPLLKHRGRVHFHAFTSETMASVSLYGYEAAQPGSRRLMRLKLAKPIVLAPGDRFVLRQPAPVATIGGGRVLDADPEPGQRKAATLAWLKQLNESSIARQIVLRVGRRNAAGLRLEALARETGLTMDAARRHVDSAIEQGELLLLPGDILLSRNALQTAASLVTAHLQRQAQKNATHTMKSSELRSHTALGAEVFDFVISALVGEQKVQLSGELVAIYRVSDQPSPIEAQRLAAISQAYEAAGLAAPLVGELGHSLGLNEAEMRRLITLLQRQKTIIRMGSDDLFVHFDALRKLVSQMAPLRGSQIDVSRFKQLTGLSRKYAIPLLEYLDRERITRKLGDQRLVL
jgi:selenocysteine-specific elongation factor